jgi:hypothetical protein
VLRELRARYDVPETRQALLDSNRQAYAAGALVTGGGVELQPEAIFQDPSSEAWLTAIAQALLAWTYPQLPIDSGGFSRPLEEKGLNDLFQAAIQGSPQGQEALDAFGPGLGIAKDSSSGRVTLATPLAQAMGTELARRSGEWPLEDLGRWLSHVQGLPHAVASLYLLAFLVSGPPQLELPLRRGHRLKLATGGRYQGLVLLPETVPALAFPLRLDQEGAALRQMSLPSAPAAALYFSALVPGLTLQEDASDDNLKPLLSEAVTKLRASVHHASEGLRHLSLALGEPLPEAAASLVQQLAALAMADSPEAATAQARLAYTSPSGFAEAFHRLEAFQQLAGLEAMVTGAVQYLTGALVPSDMAHLAVSRQWLLSSLTLRELASTSWSLQALHIQLAMFKGEYQQAYRESHTQRQRDVATLQPLMSTAVLQGETLEKLNALAELGAPASLRPLEALRRVAPGLSPCQAPSPRLDLEASPRCSRCGLTLEQKAPVEEVKALCHRVEEALAERCRHLSALLAVRILRTPDEPKVRQFIQVVQVSDLTGLVNVLDASLLQFLREVLATP